MPLDGNIDDWENVWADYDARKTTPDAPVQYRELTARQVPGPAAPSSSAPAFPRRWLLALLLLSLGVALAWVLPSWLAANRFVEAVEAGTPERVVGFANIPALQRDVASELNSRIPGTLEPGAADFLQAMAGDMTSAWGEPEALAAWLRLRHAGASGFEPVLPPLGGSQGASEVGWLQARVNFNGGVSFDLRLEGKDLRWVGINFERR